MYHKQRQIKKLNSYIPAAEAFRVFSGEKDCVFLDSSLVNDLGRYSIIGAEPYLKLVRGWRQLSDQRTRRNAD